MASESRLSSAALALGLALIAADCGTDPSPIAIAETPAPPPRPAPVAAPFHLALEGAAVQGGLLFGTATGAASLALDGNPVPLAPGGRFLLGFDRDHPASSLLEARSADGRTLSRAIAVAPRAWKIEQINIARRPSGPTADFLRLREGELARIGAARASVPASDGWRQSFVWPARGRISGVFGSQRVYRGEPASFHNGVDVAAGAGAPVVAPADGIVVLAGPPAFSLEGNLVIVAHGMGLTSAFLHLSQTLVRQGQPVRQGEIIGRVGASGRATGPHLHWGMRWGEARIDPQRLVSGQALP
ncbi:MAG TPA: M23 family metallopeptidase [Allosphingosinicella sp.]